MPPEHVHTPNSTTKRSPIQRHMHNYSLPSPTASYTRSTTPRPLRCQSSPTLSEFRQAVYIPETITETREVPDESGGQRAPRHTRRSSRSTPAALSSGGSRVPSLRAVGSDSALSLLSYYMSEPPLSSTFPPSPSASISPPASPTPVPSLCRTVIKESSPSSSSRPLSPAARPSASPSTSTKSRNPNRLSALSIASLPFPLPTPPGLASDPEWEVDPFASPPYSSTIGPPQSKWSPASSTQSLAHHRSLSTDAHSKRENAFGKLKGDMPSPTRLKGFFGRLSMNRSPGSSGFHFRNASASVGTNKYGETRGKKRRPDSLMTFVVVDEEKDMLAKGPSAQYDGTDIFGTPTTRPLFPDIGVVEQNVRTVIPASLRSPGADIKWKKDQVKTAIGPANAVMIAASAVATQASNCMDVDGIVVSQDNSITASIQSPLSGRVHAPASPSSTMPKIVSNLFTTSSNSPRALPSPRNLVNAASNPHASPPCPLAIPPSPRTPPPHPPNPLPVTRASGSVAEVLDLGFPSPPFAHHLVHGGKTKIQPGNIVPSSPTSRRLPQPPSSPVSPLQVQKSGSAGGGVSVNGPPAVPPRSKLRPPPVKIPANFTSRTTAIQDEAPAQRDASPSNIASPAHSYSSSIASLTISPMPTPPTHSRFPSASSSSKFPQHLHSASVVSSPFVISPMPTPPSMSPTSPASPSARPAFDSSPLPRPPAPEPQIDMGALRTLILQGGDQPNEDDSDSESEVGQSLKAIIQRISGEDNEPEDALTGTGTRPEFAWHEEPRSPPSRMSFNSERNRASSDIEDDAISIYSQFSSTYTFRSRSSSARRKRSMKRNGKGGRLSRRMTAMSMMSVYSQGSFCAGDAIDLPSVPTLPWGLTADSTGGPEESLLDKDLGEMTFEAPEYAYAFSWDDYVGHGLEGVALAGRAPTRSGADFETALHSGKSTQAAAEDPTPDDWRALLTTQDQEKFKRRTSSNISVVENLLTDVHDWEIPVYPRHPFADAGSLATNGSVGDMSITSVSTSAQALVPNRRQRTVRRVAPPLSSPPSNYQPPGSPSVNLSFDAEAKNGSPRRETAPRGHAAFPLVDADKQARGVRLGLRGMKSRVNVLTSRIVALTIASSRSSSSPVFPSRRGTDSYDRLPSSTSYYAMGAAEPSWPSAALLVGIKRSHLDAARKDFNWTLYSFICIQSLFTFPEKLRKQILYCTYISRFEAVVWLQMYE